MERALARAAIFAVCVSLPGLAATVTLMAVGSLTIAAPLIAALAIAATATVAAILMLRSSSSAGAAIEALGPDQFPSLPAPTNRRGLLTRAVWRAALRLNRRWQDHTARLNRELAATEAVIAALPDPLILLDNHRRILHANPAAAAYVGPSAEGRDLAARLRHASLLAGVDSVLRGEPGRTIEITQSVPIDRVLRAHVARLNKVAPDRGAALLTLYDVTELKKAEQMRTDFIANAGHELKTPLATLIGFVETLLGPARDDAESRERFLGIMREETRRMTRLVEDLLSLTRIEQSEHLPPTGAVALAPLLEHVAAALELRAGERSMRIRLDLPADLPGVQGERDQLAQLFQNLFDNAIKYGRSRSEIAVTAGIDAPSAATAVWVAVADQGDGIPPDHLPRLTERFYRIDAGRSREMGGTGLGLAIVKHILNRHRGRLDVTSTLGRGSTFTVRLPRAKAAPDSSDGAASAAVMQP